MRLLHEWHRGEGRRTAVWQSGAHGGTDPHRDEWSPVPLRRLSLDPARHPESSAVVIDHENGMDQGFGADRRNFLRQGGALLIGLSLAACATTPRGKPGTPDAT